MSARGLLVPLAGVTLIAAGLCLAEAWRSTPGGTRGLAPAPEVRPLALPPTTPPPTTTPPATPAPPPISAPPPVLVDVPAVGLQAPVVPVGLDASRQIEVPAPSQAGWYRLGPAPGAVGPAVLVGHVDSRTGPAVFYPLRNVRAGDDIVVVGAHGSRSHFVISGVTVVSKSAFPSDAVFAPTPRAEIRLVTCTGPFNPSSGHYVDSLIAWGVATT